ncbi:MAG: glucose-1-phosphate thymidylyltransferase RfbA [Hyphomicrobiales bacterium]
MARKGIILAGGTGTRLHPITLGISKQLLPVYDKPMIYYPLSLLMLAGIREIAIITTPRDEEQFKSVLGDGSQWGVKLVYLQQPSPDGLAQAYLIAEKFLDGAKSMLVLGDNILYGGGLAEQLKRAADQQSGGTIFGYRVSDPSSYGVVGFNDDGFVTSIVEKPTKPASNFAIPGIYFLDEKASQRARDVVPSDRGELEITSLLEIYLKEGSLNVELLGRGFAWLDAGTFSSLLDAGNFVRTLENRQGMQTGCPDEIAYNNGWISDDELADTANKFSKNSYGEYLSNLLNS